MGAVWSGVVAASVVWAFLAGNIGSAAEAFMQCGEKALSLTVVLMTSMALWGGVLEILSQTGDVARIGNLFRRISLRLFSGLEDRESWEAISMNLAANLFGLGNAATPAGIKAAMLLSTQGETGMRYLAMLLVINNAGVQLLPSTVIMLRRTAGAADPGDIWLPTIACSAAALSVAVTVLYLLQGKGRRSEQFG